MQKSFVRFGQLVAAVAGLFVAAVAAAQPMPTYGTAINLETAKRIAAAAVVEAKKNNWPMAIAIVDNHGTLVYYEMADDTQTASAHVAVDKARSSATFRRPTRRSKTRWRAGAWPFSAWAARCRSKAGCPSSWRGRSSARSV